MTTPSDEACSACGNSPEEHVNLRHPYTPKGASTSWLKPQKDRIAEAVNVTGPRMPPSMPFDPVLRQALIAKGVITPDDLQTAEGVIRALGMGGALSGSTESQGPTPR